MRIQHNIMAMNAYRNYNTNTSALSKNLEKLSSGYKINRAGDDAAGLAISEKMRAQITGLNAAQKNVKDGISLVKTAEGAMQEIQDMLNRMDYLATQSANGTYDDEVDRANLNKEVDALKAEINRIADSANFNGIKLLDGSKDIDSAQSTYTFTAGVTAAVSAGTNGATKTTPVTMAGVTTTWHGGGPAGSVSAGKFSINIDNLKFTASSANADVTFSINSSISFAVSMDSSAVTGSALLSNMAAGFNNHTAQITVGGSQVSVAEITVGNNKYYFQATASSDNKTLNIELVGFTPSGGSDVIEITDALPATFSEDMAEEVNQLMQGTIDITGNGTSQVLSGQEFCSVNVTQRAEAPKAGEKAGMDYDINALITAGGKLTITDKAGNATNFFFKVGDETTQANAANGDIEIDVSKVTGDKALAAAQMISNLTNNQVGTDDDDALWITAQGSGVIHIEEKVAGGFTKDTAAANQKDFDTHVSGGVIEAGESNGSLTINLTTSGSDVKAGDRLEYNGKKYVLTTDQTNIAGSSADDEEQYISPEDFKQMVLNDLGGDVKAQIEAAANEVVDTDKYEVTADASTGAVTITLKAGGTGVPGTHDTESALKAVADAVASKFATLTADSAATATNTKKALDLQIGDTSDSFNRLAVKIGDMHTFAMGTEGGSTINDISIANPEGAKDAIQVIRDAINYVSSVRGDLGAVQNRLEHTANNLSVMAENIQDAESTIRDTDIAEEMMSYTKNNILVQSAQAMLAQANAVPQGVLQLLG